MANNNNKCPKFFSIDEVRKNFKKESSSFHKGYFEAYNNPQRISKEMSKIKKRIDEKLTQGKLTKKTSDFFGGLSKGIQNKVNCIRT